MYHSLSQSLTRRHHTPQRPHRRLSSCSFLLENCDFLMLITTSVAVLIGCIVVFIWRRPSSPKVKPLEPPKHVIEKLPEIDVDDDTKKVTILFGTQTGTAKNTLCLRKDSQNALSLRKIRVGWKNLVKNNVAEPNSNSPWVVLGDMLGAPNNIIGAPKSIDEFGLRVTRGIGLASTTSDLSFMGLAANGTGELSSRVGNSQPAQLASPTGESHGAQIVGGTGETSVTCHPQSELVNAFYDLHDFYVKKNPI
ncbi:NADPH--cytochrome P450 reductase 2 [Glycine soja]|uniref:NADPH--cytochrome P450 reductase 2 n=1 Tax=Glycine soja TaxID=3848 RepID=A0A445LT28_GLYSO|nr:NADPH--cytochrome P450 reductase 2 [Glycine soja]